MDNYYRIFNKEQLQHMHEQSIKILEEKGCFFEADEAIDIFKKHGFKTENHVVYFTRKQIEDALEKVPSTFKLTAINEERSCIVGEDFLCQPPVGEVFMQDYDGTRREGTLEDYANVTKIYQAMKHMDIVGSTPIAVNDIDKKISGLYCTLELAKNSDKPWLGSTDLNSGRLIDENFKLIELAFGKKGFLEDHYVTWLASCPNSPLSYSQFACECIIEHAKWNQPVLLVSAPMAGITAPLSIYGVVLQGNVDMLAGVVLAQIITPGVPVIPNVCDIYGNMKSATWESGAPETTLAAVGGIQMVREIYNMPARAIVGGTAAKTVDYQAGFETMQGYLVAALAGMKMASQNVGTLDNVLITSLEKILIDDEMMGRVKRILKGADFSENEFSYKAIMDVDFGNTFLTHKTTIKNCRKLFRPDVSDWGNYEGWEKAGKKNIYDVAHEKVVKILAEAPESMIDKELEKDMIQFIKKVHENIK